MKPTTHLHLTGLSLLMALSLFVASCNDENRITKDDAADIAEDALTDSYFEDADDLGSISLSSASTDELSGGVASGRVRDTITINVGDTRRCIGSSGLLVTIIRYADSTPDTPKGKLILDFGTACTDLRGNTRSGKLIYEYSGKRFQPKSTLMMTADSYFINGIQLEGTRTLTNISESTEAAPKVSIVLTNGKAIFPNGEEALREASFTREWIRATNPTDDALRIGGNASGTTRNGRSYTMDIEETLVYKRNCGLPVSGVKIFTVEGKEITIDYGTGECDRSVTYTVGDRTVTTDVGSN
jgi:hypothetical protein